MKNLNDAFETLKKNAEKKLALAIIEQAKVIEDKTQEIIHRLFDRPVQSTFDLRQTFTFLASVKRTNEEMKEFYKESFGKEFNAEEWIEKPKEKQTKCPLEMLHSTLIVILEERNKMQP
jgi:hypothetical protein